MRGLRLHRKACHRASTGFDSLLTFYKVRTCNQECSSGRVHAVVISPALSIDSAERRYSRREMVKQRQHTPCAWLAQRVQSTHEVTAFVRAVERRGFRVRDETRCTLSMSGVDLVQSVYICHDGDNDRLIHEIPRGKHLGSG